MHTAALELRSRSPLLEHRDIPVDRGIYGVELPRAGIFMAFLFVRSGAIQIQKIDLARWRADSERIADALYTLLDSIDPPDGSPAIRLMKDQAKGTTLGDQTWRALRALGFAAPGDN